MENQIDITKNSYCLTIDDYRYDYLCKVFSEMGLEYPIKWRGLDKEKHGPDGCLIGHMSIIMMARALKLPYVIVYEEDAYPCIDVSKKMKNLIENRPKNCGILCFGRNGASGKIKYMDDYLIIQERPFGSHAYIIFQSAYDEFLDSLERVRIADIALRGNNFSENNKPYWTNDLLFIQRNINRHCMSNTNKYIYADKNTNKMLFTYDLPQNYKDIKCDFKIKADDVYVKHMTWRGRCTIDYDKCIINHRGDIGKLLKTEENVWKIDWKNYPDANEFLIIDNGNYIIEKRTV